MAVPSRRRTASARLACIALIAASAWALLAASGAQAAIVTVGSPLTGFFTPTPFNEVATVTNLVLPEPGAQLVSPISGTVIRWRLTASAGGPFRLRVLRPAGAATYTGAGTSAPVVPTALTTQTFATNLPVQVGDLIGVDNTNTTDKLGTIPSLKGGEFLAWLPPLAEGETRLANLKGAEIEVGFNADVQPQPTVSSISPTSGSFKGATAVTIAGTDFAGATAVSFGGIPAQSFTNVSESQITAIAPAATGPRPVDVTVTTVAGKSATLPADQFTYTACVVPKLKGKKLKTARKKLAKADCKLGKVKGEKTKSAKVTKQNPKPGKVLTPGSKVNVKLSG